MALHDEFIRRSKLTAVGLRFQGKIGSRILHIRKTSSTMDVARRIIDSNTDVAELHGTTVIADEQSHGRGRFGRAWDSKDSEDILMSIILCPRVAIASQITVMGSLASALTVDRFLETKSCIKWPNDVLVDDRKICGVIAESIAMGKWFAGILGIGLNVNSIRSDGVSAGYRATSMRQVSQHAEKLNRADVLSVLLQNVNDLYDAIDRGETIIPEWRSRLNTLGAEVQATEATQNGFSETISGIAEDVDEFGRLLIRQRDGSLRSVTAGEVTMKPRLE